MSQQPPEPGMSQAEKGRKVLLKTQENLAIFDKIFESYKNLDLTSPLLALNRKSSVKKGIKTSSTTTSELDSSTHPTSESEDQTKKVQKESKKNDLKVGKFGNLGPSKELLDLLSKSSTKKKDIKSRSKSRKLSKAKINYDVFYRTENNESILEDDAQILWKRRQEKQAELHSTRSVSFETSRGGGGDSSETEPEIRDYMNLRKSERKKLKKKGQDPTGEELMYDGKYGVIRNLHRDSISLTGYGRAEDHHLFGKSKDMFPLLTSDELKMLGVGDSRNSRSNVSLTGRKSKSKKREVGSGEGF